ncbi:hypothetical protein [Streptomyces sp. NPDC005805]|uniref:hypothetical protein n=1 Tax=Streptomyces sp. NPDC005805 TaxID=3157068 RepID=UPI0033C733AB
MEQRIEPNAQPEFAAGTDPSFVPLVGMPTAAKPTAEKAEGAEQSEKAGTADKDLAEADSLPEPADGDEVTDDAAPDAEDREDSGEPAGESADGADDGDGESAADGPSFEARDRRGSITADRAGIVFRLDDQEADFRWDEVRAVEISLPRFGRRFTVTVHVAAARWFNAEVQADSRSRLQEWETGLDAVLDAYFEE